MGSYPSKPRRPRVVVTTPGPASTPFGSPYGASQHADTPLVDAGGVDLLVPLASPTVTPGHAKENIAVAPSKGSTRRLQPLFINGVLATSEPAGGPGGGGSGGGKTREDSDELDSDVSEGGEDELVDFLNEDTFEEVSEPSPAPRSPPKPLRMPDGGDSPMKALLSPVAAPFAKDPLDYLGVLSQVFEHARLTEEQQVCVWMCAVL